MFLLFLSFQCQVRLGYVTYNVAWLPDKSHVYCPRHRSCSRPICRASVDCMMLFHCTSLRKFPWKPSAHPLSAAQHYLVHLQSNIVYIILCTCYERESSCFIPCFYPKPTFGNGIMIKLEQHRTSVYLSIIQFEMPTSLFTFT